MTTKNYGDVLMVGGVAPGSTNLLVGSLPGIKKLVDRLVGGDQSKQ